MGSRGGRGNVKVYIEGDASGLGRATKQAETSLGSLSSKLSSAGSTMTSAGSKLNRGVTVPVLAIGAVMGKTAVDFDKSMRNVNSIAQLPEIGLKKLEGQVLKLAGKTAQAPHTLAEGLYDLVSSGFDAQESLGILEKSARAATAGLTTTEVSTAAVAAELNAYHLPATKAGEISDQLFETVNRGVISFESLATNIGDVLPFASSLEVGMSQVGASISTMTKEGISAPETMTRIKNVMVTLIKPGKDLSEAIKETGYASGEAIVKHLGFQGALERLIGTTDGSKASIAKLFPNIRALGGVLALTGGNAKTAGEDLRSFRDTSGATEKALSQQSKSVSYKWNKFKAELEETAIKAAPQFLEAGKEIIGDLASMVDWFDKLSPSTKHTIVEIGLLGAALGPVLTVGGNLLKLFGGIVRIADKTAGAFRTVNTAAGETTSATSASSTATAGVKPGRFAGLRNTETYSLARSFGRNPVSSAIAQSGATVSAGLSSAKSFAGSFARGVAPAIAAAGIGNIIYTATSGDMKKAGFEAGGALVGGIAGAMTPLGPEGAMLGAGIGSFVGGALSSLFDSTKKLTPLQARLQAEADHARDAFKAQAEAARGLKGAQDRLSQSNQHHLGSTRAVTAAHHELNAAIKKFGPDSLKAHEAEIRLSQAQHRDAVTAEESKRAHQLAGNQLRLYQHRTVEAVASEKQRIPGLAQMVAHLQSQYNGEKNNYQLLGRLVGKEKELGQARQHMNALIEQAAAQSGPKFARTLERMTVSQAKFGVHYRGLTKQVPEFAKATENAFEKAEHAFDRWTGAFHSGTAKAQGDVHNFAHGTKGGFSEVEASLNQALTSLGVKSVTFSTDGPPAPSSGPLPTHAGGGIARVPGTGREDTVGLHINGSIAAVVAPGEDLIVANSWQRPELDYAVKHTYNDAGLHGFFQRSRRPHGYARGGVVTHPELTGPEPLQDAGQNAIDKVYAGAKAYYRKHAEPARVLRMYDFAEREAKKHYAYVYGGGHGQLGVGPYDCSGYVSGILGAGNFISSPMSVQVGSGLYTLGVPGDGKFFTWGVRGTSGQNAHTMISVKGPGEKWGYFESGGSGGGAHVDQGWDGTFEHRHMPGFAKGGVVPAKARDAIAKYGKEAFDPHSPHFVGWGFNRGGISIVHPKWEPRFQKWAGTVWKRAKGLYGTGHEMPPIFLARGLVGQRGDAGLEKSGTVELAPGFARSAMGSGYGQQTLLHEWAHAFQKPSVIDGPVWQREGGATDFSKFAGPKVFGSGFTFTMPSGYGGYAKRVDAQLGDSWIRHGQFGFNSGGLVVQGKASFEGGTGHSTADGKHTDEDPGFAIRDDSTLGDWFWAEVGGKSGMLQHTDWGPAEWTGRAIDFTEAGLKKIGASTDITDSEAKVTWLGNTVAGATKHAKELGIKAGGGSGADKETAQEKREKTPVHGRTKLSYEEKTSKADRRIAAAETTAGLKDNRHAIAAKLDLIRGRKAYLTKKIGGINKKLKAKLKPPVRQKLLQEREGYLGELASLPGEASGLVEQLREAGVGQKELKHYAHGLGIGVADPNAEKPTARDRADLRLAKAELTPGKADDLAALKQLLDVSKAELKAAKKSGDPAKIAEATNNLKEAADALREATPTAEDIANKDLALAELTPDKSDDLAALERLKGIAEHQLETALKSGDPAAIAEAAQNLKGAADALREATPTAEDYANRDLALAELTESTDDDRAALEELRGLAEQQLAQALLTADPTDDIEAAQNLKSVRESLDGLNQTLEEARQQERELQEERNKLDREFVELAKTQGPAMMGAFVAYLDGAIGGPLQTRRRLATAGVSAGYQ